MLIALLVIGALVFSGRLVIGLLRAAWGISKLVFMLALLPVIVLGGIVLGLVQAALPFIIIALIISFFVRRRRAIVA